MPFKFDANRLIAILQERGYDAYRDDGGGIAGRLEQAAPRLIWITPDGGVRFQVTRLVGEATTRLTRDKRSYRLSAERHEIINIWTELDRVASLGVMLDELEALATAPRSQPTAEPPPPIHEASTDDAPPLATETRMDDT